MTLPVNDAINTDTAVEKLLRAARAARQDANFFIAMCDTGTVRVHDLAASLLQNLIGIQTQWTALAAVPGIGLAVEARFPNKVFDGDTEIAAVATALDDLITFLVTQIPKDSVSNRWLLTLELDAGNKLIQRTTSNAGQIATLKAELESFVAVFDVS